MKLFHKIHFSKIDPLGDGLREDILIEQSEKEHIQLLEDNGDALIAYWQTIASDEAVVSNTKSAFTTQGDN